ncbi:hypothetical protein [Jiulongibacter sp. NS-SX5]|uniref:hypothetical protein n=1 Tax=Jiulongibacter sp. NS-SX5 TaxID=3463854 RepID=UPI004059D317
MIKKLMIPVFFLAQFANAQTIDGISLDSLDAKYISLIGIQKGLSFNEIKVNVDYGQKREFLNEKISMRLFDETGNIVVFNSMIGALNYFEKYGYQFVDSYLINTMGQNVYHWILMKSD